MPPIIACLTTNYGPFGAAAAIDQVHAAGLDHIMLPIVTAGAPTRFGDTPLVTTDSTLAELKELDRRLARQKVGVASCQCSSGNPLHADVVSRIRRKIDLASHFGVTRVVLSAGAADDEAGLQQLYRHLREIGEHAGRSGITVCFDIDRGVCVSHRGMLQLMQVLEHPQLRLNFNTASLLYYNEYASVEVALARTCHLVRHVNLQDSMGEFGRWYSPALGCGGAVDFLRVLQLMRVCRFPGPYTIEINGIEDEAEPTLEERQQRIVDSVEYLRMLGYFR
jgi:inosose dehydratase